MNSLIKISLGLTLFSKGDSRKIFLAKKLSRKNLNLNQYLKEKVTCPVALNHQAHLVHQVLHKVHHHLEAEAET